MNEAFGNPKGDFTNIDFNRVRKQYMNIFDEYVEGLKALGLSEENCTFLSKWHNSIMKVGDWDDKKVNVTEIRDALCDIQVFAMGAQHFMGVDGDDDMEQVVAGVMTRFIKDDEDKAATIAKHAANGVTHVYFEGQYPKMVMKSAIDQPDAPQGKFLKSASFKTTVFNHPLSYLPMNVHDSFVFNEQMADQDEQTLLEVRGVTLIPARS